MSTAPSNLNLNPQQAARQAAIAQINTGLGLPMDDPIYEGYRQGRLEANQTQQLAQAKAQELWLYNSYTWHAVRQSQLENEAPEGQAPYSPNQVIESEGETIAPLALVEQWLAAGGPARLQQLDALVSGEQPAAQQPSEGFADGGWVSQAKDFIDKLSPPSKAATALREKSHQVRQEMANTVQQERRNTPQWEAYTPDLTQPLTQLQELSNQRVQHGDSLNTLLDSGSGQLLDVKRDLRPYAPTVKIMGKEVAYDHMGSRIFGHNAAAAELPQGIGSMAGQADQMRSQGTWDDPADQQAIREGRMDHWTKSIGTPMGGIKG